MRNAPAMLIALLALLLASSENVFASQLAMPDRSPEPPRRFATVWPWQDVFQEVAKHRQGVEAWRKAQAEESVPSQESAVGGTADARKDPRPFVYRLRTAAEKLPPPAAALGIMVPGGESERHRETRIRVRAAVQAALAVAGYSAGRADYLEVLDAEHREKYWWLPDVLPFERYGQNNGLGDLDVVWLDETALVPNILAGLDFVVRSSEFWGQSDIKQSDTEQPESKQPKFKWRIIGPYTSHGLLEMGLEVARSKPSAFSALSEKLAFYCATATVSDATLLETIRDRAGGTPGDPGALDAQTTISGYFEVPDVKLARSTRTDTVLIRALLEELRRRGLHLGQERLSTEHVVIIADRTTIWAKALRETFKDAIAHPPASESLQQPDWSKNFHFRDYPGEPGRVTGESLDRKAFDGASRRQLPHSPRFEAFLDGLETLRAQLRAKGGGRVRAIGVFGPVSADTVEILRAVRPLFPAALFFTTDLDRRLVDPRDFEATRNLIVASNFGFQLSDEIHGGRAPTQFDSTYQSATFLTTLFALADVAEDTEAQRIDQDKIAAWIEPRLFEIGRHGAFDLTPNSSGQSFNPCMPLPMSGCVKTPYPEGTPFFPFPLRTVAFVAIAALVALVLLFILSDVFKRVATTEAVALVLPPLLVSLLIPMSFESRHGEPFSLTAGISIWPTILLASIALGLSVYFLLRGYRAWRTNIETVGKVYFGQPILSILGQRQGKTKWNYSAIKKALSEVGISSWGRDVAPQHAQDDGVSVWKEYVIRGSARNRLLRVVPVAILISVFIFLSISASLPHLGEPPSVPARGQIASHAYRLVAVFTNWAIILLALLQLDQARLFTRLLQLLPTQADRWPHQTRESFGREVGVSPEYVGSWVMTRFIADHTEPMSRFVYYPFVVLLIMIIARTNYFDNWPLSPALFVQYLVILSISLTAMVILRRASAQARAEAAEELRFEVLRQKARSEWLSAQLEGLLHGVASVRRGPLGSVLAEPVTKAAIVPFTSLAPQLLEFIWSLAQQLSRAG